MTKQMNRTDLLFALVFFLMGLYLAVSAQGFPPGAAGAPGAGFFPGAAGGVMMLLSAALGLRAQREGASEFLIENKRALTGAIILTAGYLALWGTGFFALRTVVFLALLLIFLGQRWRQALAVAAVLSAAATLAFQFGLRVSLE